MRLGLFFLLVFLLFPSLAAAGADDIELEEVFIVSSVEGDAVATKSRKFARKGEPIRLFAVVKARVDGQPVYFSTAPGVKGVRASRLQAELPPGMHIEWSRVEPRMLHEELGPNDPDAPHYHWYTNAHVPGTPGYPGWLGYDTLEYLENPLPDARDQWQITVTEARPTDARYDVNDGLGVMRYTLAVTLDGQRLRASGVEAQRSYGITPEVHMVSFRRDDSFLGWATSYYNVPGIYGSSVVQAKKYVGVDCSDFLTGAYRQATGLDVEFTSAGGMLADVNLIEGFLYYFGGGAIHADHEKKTPARTILFGDEGVMAGDIVFFCYTPITGKDACKRWHHVGALYQDSGPDGQPDGVLGADDVIFHAAPSEPRLATLDEVAHAWDGPTAIMVGRWKY